MPWWKSKSEIAGRVFAALRIRPNIDKEEISPLNSESGHVQHDRSEHLPLHRPLPIPTTALPPTQVDPTIPPPDYSSDLTVRPFSPQHFVQSGSIFPGASDITVTGGRFYAVGPGGHLTIQRTETCENNQTVAHALDIYAQTNDRRMERLEEMIGRLQLPPVVSVGFIYIMDATGRRHELTMNMARSYEQLNRALKVLFEPVTPQDRVLVKYMDIGAYDLCIDDGKEERHLTKRDNFKWSSIVQHGTTIVMSAVMAHIVDSERYNCPFCDSWNEVTKDLGRASINCDSCNRPFQSTMTQRPRPKIRTKETRITTVADHERDLIRNIHLEQFKPFSSPDILDVEWCLTCGKNIVRYLPVSCSPPFQSGSTPYCSPACQMFEGTFKNECHDGNSSEIYLFQETRVATTLSSSRY